MQKSRREFLQTLLAGTTLVPLAGCSTLDRWMMGDSRDESDKIVILGAGLAGLSAAYHLKKNQVPFRLFEASSRIGGRVMTIRDLNISSRHGELGPERIEMEHSKIQALAKELKISLLEVTTKESAAWYGNGHFLGSREWHKEAPALQKLFRTVQLEAYGNLAQFLTLKNRDQFPKAVLLDKMSAAELLNRLQSQLRPWMRPFLEQVIRSEWGVEPLEISSLHLVHWVRDSFRPFNKRYFKVSGGTSVLTQALYDRIGGVIPERFVKFHHQLTEIRQEDAGWKLYFKTPEGTKEIKAKKVLCTLPPELFRQIEGMSLLPISSEKRRNLTEQRLGNHGKILLSFQDRFWQNNSVLGTGGTWYSDLKTSSFSEAGDPVLSSLNSLHGILQSQLGGQAGAQAGLHSVDQALKDLARLDSGAKSYENISYVHNWKLFPWSQGSRAYLKPGQFQLFEPSAEYGGWAFAGDWHSLSDMGTMNGAVTTGIEAADRFFKTSS